MGHTKARHLKSNDTVFLAYGADHSMVCCGCGMVHGFTFTPGAGGVVLRIWDDGAETEKEQAKRARRERRKAGKR